LAEALITLGIIGVAAALTMPVLITNVRNRQFETGFKTAYSLMSRAVTHQIGEELYTPGEPCSSALSPNGMPICSEIFKPIFEGVEFSRNIPYKTFSNNGFDQSFMDDGCFKLKNGMLVYFETSTYTYIPIISVDINGKKGPNRFGYDTFSFIIDNGQVRPLGSPLTAVYNDINTHCSPGSANNRNGAACAYRAFSEADYFKKLK
ncbi:MAG: hypothetical protein LBJ74_00060, partial [Heliobacteriaceae bacterium]|nr:hypothetical protein [Heliobacteriaceae bacterium]